MQPSRQLSHTFLGTSFDGCSQWSWIQTILGESDLLPTYLRWPKLDSGKKKREVSPAPCNFHAKHGFLRSHHTCHLFAFCIGFMHCRHHCFISAYVSAGRNIAYYSRFCFEIFYRANEYTPEINENQFWPVAPCSNDRVVFASTLHVFIANVNQRKKCFWFTGDVILSLSSAPSSWQRSLHHQEICIWGCP